LPLEGIDGLAADTHQNGQLLPAQCLVLAPFYRFFDKA
jgi:hypothetical protein